MPEHTMTAEDVSTGELHLDAGVVTVVNVDGFTVLELISNGEARVWFTTGDQPPVVGGGRHCWYVPAGAVTGDNRGALTGARRVQLISDGAATVVLQRA